MDQSEPWLEWAVELQSLAQAGLYYSKDIYDTERYTRIREIAAEMIARKTELSLEKVKDLFCSETGYQTPKIDTRAAIFQEDRILMVHEKRGGWSLPGGWCDVNQSVRDNTVKEVREEAGLEAVVDSVIAVQDRARHNLPPYAWGMCKIFLLCHATGGAFVENSETSESRYFSLTDLPPDLALEKNTEEQIRMCFDAYHAEHWKTLVD